MVYKNCTKCGELKQLDDYRRNKNNPDGHEYQCRDCRREIGKISDHKESRQIKKMNWINCNRSLYNSYIKKWQKNNPEFYKECLINYENRNRVKRWFDKIKYRANKRGDVFDLDLNDLDIPEFCPILKIPMSFPDRRINVDKTTPFGSSPSLDRIDNNSGYVKGNVWVISSLANVMKNKGSFEDLYNFSKFFIENIKEINGEYIFKYNDYSHTNS